MSKYKLGDPDYVIPDHGEAALRWEIGRLTEQVIPALEQRIEELKTENKIARREYEDWKDKALEMRDRRIATLEDQNKNQREIIAKLGVHGEELKHCKELGKLATERIVKLEECLRFVRDVGMNTSKIDKVLNAGQR